MIPQVALWLLIGAGSMVTTVSDRNEIYSRAMNNLSHELIYCASYFEVVSIALANSNQPGLEKKYGEAGDLALLLAIEMTKEAGLLQETVTARYNLAAKEMADRIDNNTSNISVLSVEYQEMCIDLLNSPDKRLERIVRELPSE